MDCYLADVSGHGVRSGVLMAIVKSAVRMRLATSSEPQVLLEDLNRIMSELMAAEMFVTLAFVSLAKSNDLDFATAGHLPILLFRSATGSVCELSTPNPPIGIFKEQKFASSHVEFSSGDTLPALSFGASQQVVQKQEETYPTIAGSTGA